MHTLYDFFLSFNNFLYFDNFMSVRQHTIETPAVEQSDYRV